MKTCLIITWRLSILVAGLTSGLQLLIADESRKPEITVDGLTNLARGITLAELETKLKIKPLHQFSAQIESNQFLSVSIPFEKPRGSFYFLFRNGQLLAITDPPKVEFETKQSFNGVPWKTPKAVEPEDKMNRVIQGQDLSAADILERVKQWRQNETIASKGKSPLNILPAVLVVSPFFLAKTPAIRRARNKSDELTERFDAFKIGLGMSQDETKNLFGDPVRRFPAGSNCVTLVFGSDMPPNAPVHVPPVWISIDYRDDKAIQVFSHDFFDKRTLGGK